MKSPLSWILGSIALLAIVAAAVLVGSRDARRAVEMRAVEAIGDAAIGRLADAEGADRAADFINIPIEVRKLNDFVYQARGVANTHLISTSEGNVLFDVGLSLQAAKQKRLLLEATPERPLTHIILSHSHADHVGGTRFWVEDDTEVVAHWEFPEEQRYLKQLEPYLHDRNRTLFPFLPEDPPQIGLIAYGGIEPTRLVKNGEPYRFEQGGVRFEVLPTPGAEGADNLVLWLPDQKILFSGDFFGPLFPQFPNIFTMRGEKVRKPVEYIASLERIIELGPETIVPSHKDPVHGSDEIMAGLIRMRDAVRYVHDQTVAGMNSGKTVQELMDEITLPPNLELNQAHGRVSWAVKSIWEYYATWFHFDYTTELYTVPRSAVHSELAALAGSEALVKSARTHTAEGRPLHALHLLEIAIGADAGDADALRARLDALQLLLDEAESGLGNSYEIDWLLYRIRATNEQLGISESA
jgi:alkyl sulfatase BDS1-like metallo-beta-lactamase superfamily hydrolase